jgi:hypothetical protein
MAPKKQNKLVDLRFLLKSMRGKKDVMQNIIDVFLKQVPEDLIIINEAVVKTNYPVIKNRAHKMKSTVAVFGILELISVLEEMETLGNTVGEMDRIKLLNELLNKKCERAIEEMKHERLTNYR